MSRIIFPADSVGEAKAYIMALTGAKDVKIPPAPDPKEIGQVLKMESKYVSASAAAEIGFGYGSVSGSTDVRVLLQDYWFYKEVEGTIPEVNSWTFATGFRVGLRIVGIGAKVNVGIGTLAAKAETEGLNVQIQILRVGMPKGPNVPATLAVPASLDVDKFGELRGWQENVIKYVEEHRNELVPVLVSASVNISGEKLLNEVPGVRYALWRIKNGETLQQALGFLIAGKAPEVSDGEVRSIYAAVFSDPTMLMVGANSEQRSPETNEQKQAEKWLTGYKRL